MRPLSTTRELELIAQRWRAQHFYSSYKAVAVVLAIRLAFESVVCGHGEAVVGVAAGKSEATAKTMLE